MFADNNKKGVMFLPRVLQKRKVSSGGGGEEDGGEKSTYATNYYISNRVQEKIGAAQQEASGIMTLATVRLDGGSRRYIIGHRYYPGRIIYCDNYL